MCHDPSTAERFHVALPDKVTGHESRRLRLKALKMAVAKPSEKDEEPIYDDHGSVSSLSSEELRIMHQKRKRPSQSSRKTRITSNLEVPSPSQDSLLSAQPVMCKRKLDFSTEESAVSQIHVYNLPPSKCASVMPTPFSVAGQTPDCMLQTKEDKDAQTPAGHDPGCVPDPMIQEIRVDARNTRRPDATNPSRSPRKEGPRMCSATYIPGDIRVGATNPIRGGFCVCACPLILATKQQFPHD